MVPTSVLRSRQSKYMGSILGLEATRTVTPKFFGLMVYPSYPRSAPMTTHVAITAHPAANPFTSMTPSSDADHITAYYSHRRLWLKFAPAAASVTHGSASPAAIRCICIRYRPLRLGNIGVKYWNKKRARCSAAPSDDVIRGRPSGCMPGACRALTVN